MSLNRIVRGVSRFTSRIRVQPRHRGRLKQQQAQQQDSQPDESNAFRFVPELFEFRTDVIEKLSESGFDWLTHFSSVDPLHDVYGIEVCGIPDQEDAISIREILMDLFPSWKPG